PERIPDGPFHPSGRHVLAFDVFGGGLAPVAHHFERRAWLRARSPRSFGLATREPAQVVGSGVHLHHHVPAPVAVVIAKAEAFAEGRACLVAGAAPER